MSGPYETHVPAGVRYYYAPTFFTTDITCDNLATTEMHADKIDRILAQHTDVSRATTKTYPYFNTYIKAVFKQFCPGVFGTSMHQSSLAWLSAAFRLAIRDNTSVIFTSGHVETVNKHMTITYEETIGPNLGGFQANVVCSLIAHNIDDNITTTLAGTIPAYSFGANTGVYHFTIADTSAELNSPGYIELSEFLITSTDVTAPSLLQYVGIGGSLYSDFSSAPVTGINPLKVNFSDLSGHRVVD
jgi:hypothetical protein